MSYIAKTWKLNDTVTPADLNKIEQALEASEAEKIKTSVYKPTSQQGLYPVMVAQNTDGYNTARKNDGFQYATKEGTEETAGTSILIIGNNTENGTEGNKTGSTRIYGEGSYYIQVIENKSDKLTGNRSIYFPNKNGTIALTSDTMITEALYIANFANSMGYADVSVSGGYKTRSVQLTPVTTSTTTAYLTKYAIEELNPTIGTFRINGESSQSGKSLAFNVSYKEA